MKVSQPIFPLQVTVKGNIDSTTVPMVRFQRHWHDHSTAPWCQDVLSSSLSDQEPLRTGYNLKSKRGAIAYYLENNLCPFPANEDYPEIDFRKLLPEAFTIPHDKLHLFYFYDEGKENVLYYPQKRRFPLSEPTEGDLQPSPNRLLTPYLLKLWNLPDPPQWVKDYKLVLEIKARIRQGHDQPVLSNGLLHPNAPKWLRKIKSLEMFYSDCLRIKVPRSALKNVIVAKGFEIMKDPYKYEKGVGNYEDTGAMKQPRDLDICSYYDPWPPAWLRHLIILEEQGFLKCGGECLKLYIEQQFLPWLT